MLGKVYRVKLTDADKARPHWYVTVLYVKDNKNCLLIPAYSADGAGVQGFLDEAKKTGYPSEAVAVQMDNQTAIELEPGFPGHLAWWVSANWAWWPRQEIVKGDFVGTMRSEALARLAGSLLAWDKVHKGKMFAQCYKDALRKIIQNADEA